MEIPTEITFHEIPHSDAVEASVHRWVTRLQHVFERVSHCRVIIAQPHRRHRSGKDFEIHIRLSLPGEEIASTHTRHQDPYVAIADAFRAARRQLLDFATTRRGHGRQQLTA